MHNKNCWLKKAANFFTGGEKLMRKKETSFKIKQLLVLAALVGAIIAAYGKGNTLAYIGIAFYAICAVAVIINQRRTSLLLWFAVLAHAALIGYMVWDWQINGIIPCSHCTAAAGFSLFAAVAWWKTPLALLPAVLMIVIWYEWSIIFPLLGGCGC
jgi:hypothetical protein